MIDEEEAKELEAAETTSIANKPGVLPAEEDWLHWLTDRISETAVSTAVSLKQSPIPDALGFAGDVGLEGYRKVNDGIDIQNKIAALGQKLIKTSLLATGVFATAAIKAGVAYQRAPGYYQQEYINETSPNVSSSSNNSSRRNAAIPLSNYRMRYIRTTDFPGSFPSKELFDAATQTLAIQPSPEHANPPKNNKQSEDLGYLSKVSSYASSFLLPYKITKNDKPSYTQTELNTTPNMRKLNHSSSIDALRKVNKNSSSSSARKKLSAKSFPSYCPTISGSSDEEDDAEDEEHFLFDNILIHLNIGGVLYDTKLETLMKLPKSRIGKMFTVVKTRILNERYQHHKFKQKRELSRRKNQHVFFTSTSASTSSEITISEEEDEDEEDDIQDSLDSLIPYQTIDGKFFIDRDGTYFKYILNYLRDYPEQPSPNLLPDTPKELWGLISDCKYYDIEPLKLACLRKIYVYEANKKWIIPLSDFINGVIVKLILIIRGFKEYGGVGGSLAIALLGEGQFRFFWWFLSSCVLALLVQIILFIDMSGYSLIAIIALGLGFIGFR